MYSGVIYCLISPSNKKYYGYTTNFERRKIEHIQKAKLGKINSLYSAIRKYGFENFIWNIIEVYNNESEKILHNILCEREIYWIIKDKTHIRKYGYNMTKGGDGIFGCKRSEETKKKISESLKGEKHPNYKKAPWNKGKKTSEETKKKLSLSHKGKIYRKSKRRKPSDETREKQRKALIGRIPWNKGKKIKNNES
jgi:group I intron endonuclease